MLARWTYRCHRSDAAHPIATDATIPIVTAMNRSTIHAPCSPLQHRGVTAVPDQQEGSAIELGYGECLVTSGTSRSQFYRLVNAQSRLAFIQLSGASSVDDYDIPGETVAEKIAFLRTAPPRCRRLSAATGDYRLNETLSALADE